MAEHRIGDAVHIVIATGYGPDVVNGAIVAVGPDHVLFQERSTGKLVGVFLPMCTIIPGHVFQAPGETRAEMCARECLKTREWRHG